MPKNGLAEVEAPTQFGYGAREAGPAPRPAVVRQQTAGERPQNLVHLLLCTNALYLQHAAVCLASLLANNQDLAFDIVVVSRPTEKLEEDALRRSLPDFSKHALSFLKFTPPAKPVLPLNPGAHFTLDNWTRLWVERFFANDVTRVLYLDCDLVVVGSIAELWRADLEGALFGAVDIPGAQRGVTHLGMRPEDGYFNSGVLVIDLEQWRATSALDTVLDYVAAYPERVTIDLDQEALNACFHVRRKRLDYKWNVTYPFFRNPAALPLTPNETAAVLRDARIIHFNGNLKPWSYFCDHPRKSDYQKYLRMTEWRDFVPPDRTLLNILRKRLSPMLSEEFKKDVRALARRISHPIHQREKAR